MLYGRMRWDGRCDFREIEMFDMMVDMKREEIGKTVNQLSINHIQSNHHLSINQSTHQNLEGEISIL